MTEANRLKTFNDMIGKTVANIERGTDNHYETQILKFSDGTFIEIVGGGYDGYGDYIDVFAGNGKRF